MYAGYHRNLACVLHFSRELSVAIETSINAAVLMSEIASLINSTTYKPTTLQIKFRNISIFQVYLCIL